MASEKSAIEVLADGIRSGECDILVSEVLVPEQCMCVAIGDKLYSVSAEEMTEEVVKGYNDKPATLSPEFLRQAQAAAAYRIATPFPIRAEATRSWVLSRPPRVAEIRAPHTTVCSMRTEIL